MFIYVSGEFIREKESEMENMCRDLQSILNAQSYVTRYRIDDELEFQGDDFTEAGIVGGKVGVFVELPFDEDSSEGRIEARGVYDEIADTMWAYKAHAVHFERY